MDAATCISESKQFLKVLFGHFKVDRVDDIPYDLLMKSPSEGLAKFLHISARAVEGFVANFEKLETDNSKLKGQLINCQDSVITLQKQLLDAKDAQLHTVRRIANFGSEKFCARARISK